MHRQIRGLFMQDWVLAEVYPHPAMVRLCELSERISYKLGRVNERLRKTLVANSTGNCFAEQQTLMESRQ